MAANRRRLVHRLQAEDPLDLSASGDKYTLHTSSADSPTLDSNVSAAGMLSIHEPASAEHIRPVRSVLW